MRKIEREAFASNQMAYAWFATMSVAEFLTHVRRLVIGFVVGRVLTGGESPDLQMADRLDCVTAYYLLHRNERTA